MQCIKCKKEIPEGSLFCNWCGAKQEKRPYIKRANGTGSVEKRGSKYLARVRVYDPELRTLSKTFDKRKDALNALPALRDELLSSNGRNAVRKTQTLTDLYDVWSTSAMEQLSKSKQTAYAIAWRRCASVSAMPLPSVTIADLQPLLEGLSYYQARDVKSLLSHLFKRACAQGDAVANLSEFMVLPKLEETEAEPFTLDEVAMLWQRYSEGDTFLGFVLLMIYTGMMPGELLDCKKDMIDLEHGRITGAGKKTKERKTKAIVLPDVILPVLSVLMSSHPHSSLVGMNKDKFYAEYHIHIKSAAVRDLPPYACRHTTATVLAQNAEVAPTLITKALRQVRPITTERYKHADEEQVRSALNKMTVPSSN